MSEADQPWPECPCGEDVNPRRWALGYRTCLKCGSPRQEFLIMEVPKSSSIVTANPKNLKGLGGSHKGNRQAL